MGVFMRRHTPAKTSKVPVRQSTSAALAKLSSEQLSLLGKALSAQSLDSMASAYKGWSLPWTGMISEWDILTIVRKLLGLSEQEFSDDVVHTLWTSLDREGQGQIEAAEL